MNTDKVILGWEQVCPCDCPYVDYQKNGGPVCWRCRTPFRWGNGSRAGTADTGEPVKIIRIGEYKKVGLR